MKSNHAVRKGYVAEDEQQCSTNHQDLNNEYIFITETSSDQMLDYNVIATFSISKVTT